MVQRFLTEKGLGSIERTYQKVGFPKFNIHTMVDDSASQKQLENLQTQKKARDEKLAAQAQQAMNQTTVQKEAHQRGKTAVIGRKIADGSETTQLEQITDEERSVIINGYVFDREVRKLRSGRKLLILKLTDYSSSITVKKFSKDDEEALQFDQLQVGDWLKIRGTIQEDNYAHELVMNAYDINPVVHENRQDQAEPAQKRVELHLHSNMSQMDATNSITDFVKQAHTWGQPALAITDHDNVQAFPDAFRAAEKYQVKMLYGMEANVVDDGEPIAYNDAHRSLRDATYVIFDTETTGLSAVYDRVIELSAVKMQGNQVIEKFEEFIDPKFHLSEQTTNLTSITDEMVAGSKSEAEVFRLFREFCGDAIIVGHNVTFDIGFMDTGYRRHDMEEIKNPIIDTLTLSRFLYPDFKSYRLNTLAKKI